MVINKYCNKFICLDSDNQQQTNNRLKNKNESFFFKCPVGGNGTWIRINVRYLFHHPFNTFTITMQYTLDCLWLSPVWVCVCVCVVLIRSKWRRFMLKRFSSSIFYFVLIFSPLSLPKQSFTSRFVEKLLTNLASICFYLALLPIFVLDCFVWMME